MIYLTSLPNAEQWLHRFRLYSDVVYTDALFVRNEVEIWIDLTKTHDLLDIDSLWQRFQGFVEGYQGASSYIPMAGAA